MLRSLIALRPWQIPLRVALRNTAAVVGPLAIGVATGQVHAGLGVASGALNTMSSDEPGPYRQRLLRMLAAALATGMSALVGIMVGPSTPAFALAAVFFGWTGGLLVALGPVAARVGLTSMIVMMITAEMGLARTQAPAVAALMLAGGLLQMAFAIAAWPLQRYRPERFALATVLEQLQQVARERPDPASPPPVSMASLEAMALLHGRHRAGGLAAQAFRIIAEVCERVRIDLLSLVDLAARIDDAATREALHALLDAAAAQLGLLASAMQRAEAPAAAGFDTRAMEAAATALAACIERLADGRDRRLGSVARERVESLAGQLRSLARNGDWASSRGEIRAQAAEARLPTALRQGDPAGILRANLGLSSVAMRHAVRCSTCLGRAVVAERLLAIPHGVWIPMTAAIVLKPDFGGTMRFGILRVAGTFAGLLLTTLIVHFALDTPWLQLALMAVLCFGFRLLAPVNYAIAVAMLTGLVVLLFAFEGIAPGAAMHMRIVGTTCGSALALVAYLLWPTWEGRRLDAILAGLVDAYRAHIAAVLRGDIDALYETRTAARAARTRVMASFERVRAEPARSRARQALRRNESFLANAHRLIRASLSLEAVLRDRAGLPPLPELGAFAGEIDAALAAQSAFLREGTPLPASSPRAAERALAAALAADGAWAGSPAAIAIADTCDRLADSIDTLSHVLRAPD
jgi:uncharacterized membrane protein YccC